MTDPLDHRVLTSAPVRSRALQQSLEITNDHGDQPSVPGVYALLAALVIVFRTTCELADIDPDDAFPQLSDAIECGEMEVAESEMTDDVRRLNAFIRSQYAN